MRVAFVRRGYHSPHMVAFSVNAVNPYLKAIVALAFTVLTGLATYYGHSAWYPIVTSAVGSVMVYLTPNTPAPIPPKASDKPPFTGD